MTALSWTGSVDALAGRGPWALKLVAPATADTCASQGPRRRSAIHRRRRHGRHQRVRVGRRAHHLARPLRRGAARYARAPRRSPAAHALDADVRRRVVARRHAQAQRHRCRAARAGRPVARPRKRRRHDQRARPASPSSRRPRSCTTTTSSMRRCATARRAAARSTQRSRSAPIRTRRPAGSRRARRSRSRSSPICRRSRYCSPGPARRPSSTAAARGPRGARHARDAPVSGTVSGTDLTVDAAQYGLHFRKGRLYSTPREPACHAR